MTALLTPTSASIDRDGRPIPRWANRAAHLVTFAVLPSGLWRIPLALGASMGMIETGTPAHVDGAESVYIIGLSVFTEALALLTLGLVRPWGERVPGWIPRLGGRRIPPRPVVAVAALGALFLALIWGFAFRNFPTLPDVEWAHDGWYVLFLACYMPLLLWAPLLAAATYGYYRRRCRD